MNESLSNLVVPHWSTIGDGLVVLTVAADQRAIGRD